VVDKIDRPDPVSNYEIQKSHETHDEGQQRQPDQRDEHEDHQEEKSDFSSPGIESSWNKFKENGPKRNIITVQRDNIRQAIFRQASLKHNSAVLEADLILRSGQTLTRAAYVSNNMDDYWKWKGWAPGQLIPIELMIQGAVIQVSVPTSLGASVRTSSTTQRTVTPASQKRKPHPWKGPHTGSLNWLWIVKVSAGTIIALWVIGKWARWW